MATEPSTQTTPSAPDYDDIVHAVELYVAGFNDGDPSKFREAFHDDAWIFFTDSDGTLHNWLISEAFEEWGSQPAKPGDEVVLRIISVIQAGEVASVILGFDYPPDHSDSWVDIHNLLRIDGVWKITNKTATHHSRAAWASPEAASA